MTITTTRLKGSDAIDYASSHDLTLNKYNDPTEDAREGLTPDEARAIAREDQSLIYIDVTEDDITTPTTTTTLKADTRYTVSGNTYPHRATLQAMGGKWNAATKSWTIWTGIGHTWLRERAELTRIMCDGVDIVAIA
jgi:hypothetical protein